MRYSDAEMCFWLNDFDEPTEGAVRLQVPDLGRWWVLVQYLVTEVFDGQMAVENVVEERLVEQLP